MKNLKLCISLLVFAAFALVSCDKDDDNETEDPGSFSTELYGTYASEDGNFVLELGDTAFIVNGINYYHHIENRILDEKKLFKFTTYNGVQHQFSSDDAGNIEYRFVTPFGTNAKSSTESKSLAKLILKTVAKKIIKYGISSARCRDTRGLDIGNNKLYVLAKLSNGHYDAISIKLREDGSLPLDPDDPDITQIDSTIFAADAVGSEGSDLVFQENNGTTSSDGDFVHLLKKSLAEVRSYYATNIDQGATNGVTTQLATAVGANPRQGAAANEYLYMNSNDKMVYIGKFYPNQGKDKIDKIKIKHNDCSELHGLCIEPNDKQILYVSCSDKDGYYWIESYAINPTSDKGAKNFSYISKTEKTKVRNYQQLICDGSIVYALSNHQGHTLDVFDLQLNAIEIEDKYVMQEILDEMELVDFKSSDMALTKNSLYVSNGDENSDEERRVVMLDLVDYAERAKMSENLSNTHMVKLERQ